jgi:hypothetical protein
MFKGRWRKVEGPTLLKIFEDLVGQPDVVCTLCMSDNTVIDLYKLWDKEDRWADYINM